MAKELTTQQKVDKIVELYNQIKEIGFSSHTLMIHHVPVSKLGKNWRIKRLGGDPSNVLVAGLIDKDNPYAISDISLFDVHKTSNIKGGK